MGRGDNNQPREEGRGGRRGAAEATEVAPLVSSKRGKFEVLENTKIEAPVFGRFKDYKAFVAELEGEEPEDGAVISAGLEMLFEADKGFERWYAEQRRKGRNGSGANGNGAGKMRRLLSPVLRRIRVAELRLEAANNSR